MSKGQESSSKGAGRGSAGKGSAPAGPCTLKFLAPEALAAGIIGKGGAVIAGMRESCQAKLGVSEKSEVHPGTDCRILTASAQTEENLNEVIKQIIAKVVELAEAGNSVEAVGTKDEMKLKTLLPRAAVGGLIGKGGASVKQMREQTGAKININEPVGSGPGAEQLVSVAGTKEALEHVFLEANKQVQLLNTEAWYANWASTNSAQAGYPGSGGIASYVGGYGSSGSPGIQNMMQVASSLPPYVMEDSRGFAMSCIVPNRLVGGLIGKNGQGFKEIQTLTGTKVNLREIPDDPENRSLNIAGPLSNTCTAYMLLMKRYLDVEAAAAR